VVGTGADPLPKPLPIVRKGPRFATSPEDVRPPYPEAMRAAEKEAVLRLRLSIDARGRVVAVEPIGKAEPAFLAAARRHILRVWRYSPAMAGDTAIASTTMVTLEFKLDS
jgi:protein TonB